MAGRCVEAQGHYSLSFGRLGYTGTMDYKRLDQLETAFFTSNGGVKKLASYQVKEVLSRNSKYQERVEYGRRIFTV